MSSVKIELSLHLNPSEIFTGIPLSLEFEGKYNLQEIILNGHNPNYLLQKEYEKRNVNQRKPFLYQIESGRIFGHTNLVSNSNFQTSILSLIFNLNKHKIFGKEEKNEKNYEVLKNGNLLISYDQVYNYKEGFFIGGSDNFGHWLF